MEFIKKILLPIGFIIGMLAVFLQALTNFVTVVQSSNIDNNKQVETSSTFSNNNMISNISSVFNNNKVETNIFNYSEITSATQLSILNQIGSVNLSYNSGDEVEILVQLVQSSKGAYKEEVNIEQIHIEPKLIGDILLLEAKTRDGTDFWTWVQKNFNTNNVEINFDVLVPASIHTVKVYNSMGNVTANDLKSSLDIEVGMGTIIGHNLSPHNYINVDVGMGSIDMIYSDISNAALLNLSSGMGSINIEMPNDAVYKVKNSLPESLSVEINNEFSDRNTSHILQDLLSIKHYQDESTIVLNYVGLGAISIN